MGRVWMLVKGEEVLGMLTETGRNMQFVNCRFDALAGFASYQAAFAKALQLLPSEIVSEWEQAYEEIRALGLVLEPGSPAVERIDDFHLYIDGEKAWFRY